MPRQRGRKSLAGAVGAPEAIRLPRASLADLLAEAPQLVVLGRFEPPDLTLERPDTGDLADVGRNAPEQQVASDVESPRRDVPLVSLRFHLLGAGQLAREIFERAGADLPIGVEQR